MRPTLALSTIETLTAPHRGGHRCTSGDWHNDNVGDRLPCPVLAGLTTVREQVQALHEQVHNAAHDTGAAVAVAEGMTGLVMAELHPEDREGWTLAARMAVEALAAHLDRDPALEARAQAVRDRLTAAGITTNPSTQETP